MNTKAIVLAAGRGTRLVTEGVDLPKVMREIGGQPLLHYVLSALDFLRKQEIILVVGYQKEKVSAYFPDYPYAVQAQQLGTGHAVLAAREQIGGGDFPVLVCCGDMPLLRRETYLNLLSTHQREGNACTVLSGQSELALSFGRVIRDENGRFAQIIEERDCTPAQREISELNAGVYVFQSAALFEALARLDCNNSQNEYYLTDVPARLRAAGAKIGICKRELGLEILGVNTMEQLKQAEAALADRQS